MKRPTAVTHKPRVRKWNQIPLAVMPNGADPANAEAFAARLALVKRECEELDKQKRAMFSTVRIVVVAVVLAATTMAMIALLYWMLGDPNWDPRMVN